MEEIENGASLISAIPIKAIRYKVIKQELRAAILH